MRRSAKRWAVLAIVASPLMAAAAGSATAADWRDSVKVLRVGFVSSATPAADLTRLEPFRALLAARTGVPVDLVPATTAADLVDAEVTARIDYAIDSAMGYVSAAAECDCVEPLAEPVAADGSRGYYAVLVARADGAIHDLAGSAGARLALGAPDSVAGRLIPMKAFAAAGLDPATHFAALYEASGPQDAVAALLDGRADLAVAWSSLAGDAASGYSFGALARMVADGRLAMDQVRVIWQSRLIAFGPHTVRKSLPPELKALLLDALVTAAGGSTDVLDAVDRSPSGGGGFVAVTAADYAPLAELVTAL